MEYRARKYGRQQDSMGGRQDRTCSTKGRDRRKERGIDGERGWMQRGEKKQTFLLLLNVW